MPKNIKPIKAWADVGSNGGIFEFQLGPVAQRYPHLMHIFSEKVSDDLIPVLITPIKPAKRALT